MDLRVTMSDEGPSGDRLRDLRAWLVDEDGLRGRIALADSPPRPGTLGPTVDALSVALGSGGAVSVLIGGVVSWLRQRSRRDSSNRVRVTIRRPDGSGIEIDRDGASEWPVSDLSNQVARLVRELEGRPSTLNRPDEGNAEQDDLLI